MNFFSYNRDDNDSNRFNKLYPYISDLPSRSTLANRFKCDMHKVDLINLYNLPQTSYVGNVGATSVLGLRPSMEDTISVQLLPNGVEFYAVYDGHGGWEISALLQAEFYKLFNDINIINFSNTRYMSQIISQKCFDFGKVIYNITNCDAAGSTAIIALRHKQNLYLINIGDSGAIVYDNNGLIHCRTKAHKPYDNNEKSRIEKRGGSVFNQRVNGVLAVSRSFGDNSFNRRHRNYVGFESLVTHEPDIYHYEIPTSGRIYLLLASDGLWDNCIFDAMVAPNKFNFMQCVRATIVNPLHLASQEIVKMAYDTGIFDNISVVLVRLN